VAADRGRDLQPLQRWRLRTRAERPHPSGDPGDRQKLIWLETTREDSGQGLAKDAVGQGADLVIATGGDGTVMACATALAGSEVPLAVLPLGTGNLVAANFDIPNDLDQALEIALECRRRRIDLGSIGGGRFVIAAGMGFDAAMLRDASHTLKARIGPLAYVWSALRNLRRPRASYRLRLDGGEELTRRAQGVLVANLGKIQGGLPILPDAVPDDGQFDIAVLKTRTVGDWVGVAARILVRSRKAGPDVDTFRAHTVEIRCDRAQPVSPWLHQRLARRRVDQQGSAVRPSPARTWVSWPPSGARAANDQESRPAMRLTEPATITTPNRYDKKAWASTVPRIHGSRTVVSDTW
jgi:diacylglycerol kinase family enzyme